MLSRSLGLFGYRKGEVIPFGPFEWRVLSVGRRELLLITEEVIDCMWYQVPMRRGGVAHWEDSALRSYLNGGFIRDNFTGEQHGCMRPSIIGDDPDPHATSDQADPSLETVDVVFCLSAQEALSYFEGSPARKAMASDHVRGLGDCAATDGSCAWWLRSDAAAGVAYVVGQAGEVTTDWASHAGRCGIGVRPAVRISRQDYRNLATKTSPRYTPAAVCCPQPAPFPVRGEASPDAGGLLLAASSGDAGETERLLGEGADPDARGVDGLFPLCVAARHGHADVVRLLMDAGADVDMQTPEGASALLCAAREGRAEVVRLLLASGADRTIADRAGDTPLMAADRLGHHDVAEALERIPQTPESLYLSASRTLAALRYYEESLGRQGTPYRQLGLGSAAHVIERVESAMGAALGDASGHLVPGTIEAKVRVLAACPADAYAPYDVAAEPLCYLEKLLEDATDYSTDPMVTRAIEDACREYRELIRPMGEAVGDIDAYLLGNVLSYLDIAMAIDDAVPDEHLGHGLYGRNWADAPSGSG